MVAHLVEATRTASGHDNWHAALALSLTLPDICGRLESPHTRSQLRYEYWWRRWVQPRYTVEPDPLYGVSGWVIISGKDAYALRCAVLHEGRDEIVEQRAREALDRFVFVDPHTGLTDRARIGRTLVLRVDEFCEAICTGVEDWAAEVFPDKREVAARAAGLMTVQSYPLTIGNVTIEE